jgi:hypothetical protein
MNEMRRTGRNFALAVAATVAIVVASLFSSSSSGAQSDTTPGSSSQPTDLSVSNVISPLIPRTGGVGLLVATIGNAADGAAATNVTVPYTLPDGATFDDTVTGASPGCTATGNLVTCAVGNLDPGTSVPVGIGVRVAAMDATTLVGTFGQPTSDEWDPNAGEIRYRTWYHEADVQGASVQVCWPLTSESPNMDIDGSNGDRQGPACDGTVDHPALRPDVETVVDSMPSDVAVTGPHSWEMSTRITPPASGTYQVCTFGFDDGGYVAIAPVGQPLDPTNVVVDVVSFGDAHSTGTVALDSSVSYQVLVRVSNRGKAGVDDATDPGGFGAIGIVPDGTDCTPASSASFGTGPGAYVSTVTVPGPIIVLPAAAVRTTGTVTAGDGSFSQARVVNDGPDSTLVNASAAGEIQPVPSVNLDPGGATVFGSFMTPGADGVIGVNPWTITTSGTLPPQP